MWIADFPYVDFAVSEQWACVQLSGGQVEKLLISTGFSRFWVAVPSA